MQFPLFYFLSPHPKKSAPIFSLLNLEMAAANTLIHSLRIILMSSGTLFIAILLSLSLNPLLSSAAADLPSFWSSLSAWLRPPYLYFIINGIIIAIAASSRLHYHSPPPEVAPHQTPKMSPPPQYLVRAEQFSTYDAFSVAEVVSVGDSYYAAVSVKEVDVEVLKSTGIEERQGWIVEEVKTPEVEFEISAAEIDHGTVESEVADEMSKWTPPAPSPLERQQPVEDSPEFFLERPPASSRFGPQRRAAKASPAEGGKKLRRVAKPKKHETLESTWKATTEGRAMPLTRHLKKSDAWEDHCHQIDFSSTDQPPVKKSETFKDRTNYVPPPVPSSRLKEPSLSQDELNRRVEAFINKFNEEMRLQRQQSIEQFMDKISRI